MSDPQGPTPDDGGLDLAILGGHVLHPGSGLDAQLDVGIRYGRIVALEPDLTTRIEARRIARPEDPPTKTIDATGLIVSPGFIDLHTHVYVGVGPLTVPADETASRTGVTTCVSAGDAGAHTIEGFRRLAVEASRTRVLAFLHVSTVGLAPWPAAESADPDLLDVPAGIRAALEHPDIVVGVKVRMTQDLIGDLGLEPLRRAIAIGDAAGIPVMVHIGNGPGPLAEILDLLRPGDVITHCFTGLGRAVVADGRLADGVLAARERGIRFDVGHGSGSFAFRAADIAVAAGFWPDTISTDLHSLSANAPAVDLPTTMSKFLALGMPLPEIVLAVTATPAEVLGRAGTLGAIALGRAADIAIFDLEEVDRPLTDAVGEVRTGHTHIRVRHTVRAGIPWFGPWPHPGRGVGVQPD